MTSVTVVTACFNAVRTIGTTLQSVRSQTLARRGLVEHIVVDGCSADGTADLVREWSSHRPPSEFRWISERDRGLYDAINKGIALAKGDVIAILNADDVFADDDVLERVARRFDEGGERLDAVWSDIRFVRRGDTVDALRAAPTVRYCSGRYFRNWMFRFATFPAHPGTFVRRRCYERFGLYSLDYRICADFEMMVRLFLKNGITARYLPMCATVMRMGGLSTGGIRSNIEINREDLRALRDNGYWSCLALIYLKYPFKATGFLRRSRR